MDSFALKKLLVRPIAFHRCFVDVTGSVSAALFLSQAVYWQTTLEDTDREGGMWFKTQAEWEAETALTRFEQEAARKVLLAKKLLKEKRAGIPAKLWFYVDFEVLWKELNCLSSVRMTNDQECDSSADKIATPPQSSNRAETTTETTTETTPPNPQRGNGTEVLKPVKKKKGKKQVISREEADSQIPEILLPVRESILLWFDGKAERGDAYTPTGWQSQMSQLAKKDVARIPDLIENALARGWMGIHEEFQRNNGYGATPTKMPVIPEGSSW